jgi:hypothetical protein
MGKRFLNIQLMLEPANPEFDNRTLKVSTALATTQVLIRRNSSKLPGLNRFSVMEFS